MLCYSLSRRMLLAAAFGLAACHVQAASSVETIRQALASGQLEQASKLVTQEKLRQPQDAEIRFLEGVVQAQQGQSDKAIETFRKLVESHPGIVEAHNNLGVLYASKGRLEEARKALEAGMHAHASYAALHRNLADVQSQLVKQTYAKALQVDSKARTAVTQLSLIASLQPWQPQQHSDRTPAAASHVTQQAQPPAASAPAVVALVPAMEASRPAASSVAPSTSAAALPRAPQALSEARQPAPGKPATSSVDTTETEAIRSAIQAWAQAWSQKNMDGYLQAYAGHFAPPDRLTRSKWEAERRQRIVSKKSISVEVRQLKVKVEDKTATAQFQQIYSSDNFTGNSRKTLEMVKQGGRWLIVRETVN